MGGDHGPRVTLAACRRFLDSHPDARLLLVGLPEALKDFTHARSSVVPASEVVGMDDPIEVALRRKKQSSMRIAIEQVHSGTATAIDCTSAMRTPAASPIRPAGAWACSSDITIGWPLPSPRPRQNDSGSSSAVLRANGKTR